MDIEEDDEIKRRFPGLKITNDFESGQSFGGYEILANIKRYFIQNI